MAKKMLEEIEKDSPLTFQVIELEILGSQLGPFVEDIPQETEFKFSLEINHLVNLSTGIIRIVVNVIVKNAETNAQYASLRVGVGYQIENIQQQPLEDGKISREKMQILNNTSVSTARGIFYSMVRGTFLQRAIMPVIPSDYFVQG